MCLPNISNDAGIMRLRRTYEALSHLGESALPKSVHPPDE